MDKESTTLNHSRLEYWMSLGEMRKIHGHNIFVINQPHQA